MEAIALQRRGPQATDRRPAFVRGSHSRSAQLFANTTTRMSVGAIGCPNRSRCRARARKQAGRRSSSSLTGMATTKPGPVGGGGTSANSGAESRVVPAPEGSSNIKIPELAAVSRGNVLLFCGGRNHVDLRGLPGGAEGFEPVLRDAASARLDGVPLPTAMAFLRSCANTGAGTIDRTP